MKYFLAVEKAEKPFISWASVANSLEEYEALGFDTNSLVIPENDVPEPVFGVCPLKIVAGELVERTAPEMAAFEAEWDISEAMKANFNRLPEINADKFTFDSKEFPMDEVSRLFYIAIEKIRGNQKIMTVENELYDLVDASTNIDDFMEAYYTRLLAITKHDI